MKTVVDWGALVLAHAIAALLVLATCGVLLACGAHPSPASVLFVGLAIWLLGGVLYVKMTDTPDPAENPEAQLLTPVAGPID